jgi:DNA polymerase-3 subunit epsilon
VSSLEFVALDVETANHHRGSICAIGLSVVEAGRVTQRHSWLCQPPRSIGYFDAFNVALHGISEDQVAAEPTFHQRMSDALAIIGDRPVVAHNAAFDIGAIRAACDAEDLAWPELRYGCTLVWARRVLDLISYRLPIVTAELGITLRRHHDAAEDAQACAEILLALAERTGSLSVEGLAEATHTSIGTVSAGAWRGCHSQASSSRYRLVAPTSQVDADPAHPLYGEVVVFTGALAMLRQDAWNAVAMLGGTPAAGVTSRTTRLVIGGGFSGNDPADFRSGKAGKAVKLLEKGKKIEVLTEADFESLLFDSHTSGEATQINRQAIKFKKISSSTAGDLVYDLLDG